MCKEAKEAKMSTLLYLVQNNLSESELLCLYNEFAESHNYEIIKPMEELNDEMLGLDFLDAYREIDHNNFAWDDEYYFYDSYGEIVSRCDVYSCVEELTTDEKLAEYLNYNWEVGDILEDNVELMLEEFLNFAYAEIKKEYEEAPEAQKVIEYIEKNMDSSYSYMYDWHELLVNWVEEYRESKKG